MHGTAVRGRETLGGAVTEKDFISYTVAYDQDEIQFPVYVLGAIAVGLLVAAALYVNPALLALGFLAACAALYNFPLIETGRPRLGAGQHGLFIEGLGLIAWRSIDRIEILPDVVRGVTFDLLEIELKTPIDRALIIDWRKRPWWRWAMRLPAWVSGGRSIKVTLGVLDRPPLEIRDTFLRMWRYHRGATGVPMFDEDDAGDDKSA